MITGARSSKETIDGSRNIFIRGDMAFMEQSAPRYQTLAETESGINVATIMSSIALSSSDLIPGHEPTIVNTGVNCLVVPLHDEDALLRITPDFPAIERLSSECNLVFQLRTAGSGS